MTGLVPEERLNYREVLFFHHSMRIQQVYLKSSI